MDREYHMVTHERMTSPPLQIPHALLLVRFSCTIIIISSQCHGPVLHPLTTYLKKAYPGYPLFLYEYKSRHPHTKFEPSSHGKG